MNSDFKDLLQIFVEEGVEYLVVGGYAVIQYSQPRYTKDLDLWLKPSVLNSKRVYRAFQRFGIPLLDVVEEDFSCEGLQYAIGMPPAQIDFLTSLPGVPDFDHAKEFATETTDLGFSIYFIGKQSLIKSKQTAGRAQDVADLEELNRL